jgi:hypothetical protein
MAFLLGAGSATAFILAIMLTVYCVADFALPPDDTAPPATPPDRPRRALE